MTPAEAPADPSVVRQLKAASVALKLLGTRHARLERNYLQFKFFRMFRESTLRTKPTLNSHRSTPPPLLTSASSSTYQVIENPVHVLYGGSLIIRGGTLSSVGSTVGRLSRISRLALFALLQLVIWTLLLLCAYLSFNDSNNSCYPSQRRVRITS